MFEQQHRKESQPQSCFRCHLLFHFFRSDPEMTLMSLFHTFWALTSMTLMKAYKWKKKNLMIEKQIKVVSLQWHCFAEIDWAISSVNASEKDSSGKPPFQTASSWYTRCTSNTHTNNFSFLNSDVTPNVVCIAIFSVKVCSYPVKWIFTLCSSLCNMKLMKCSNLSMKLSTLKWQVFQFYCPTHVCTVLTNSCGNIFLRKIREMVHKNVCPG